jgi:hypothetical protein
LVMLASRGSHQSHPLVSEQIRQWVAVDGWRTHAITGNALLGGFLARCKGKRMMRPGAQSAAELGIDGFG